MTFAPPPRPARPGAPRRRRVLVPTLAVLAVLVVLVSVLASVGTEVLWYRQVGYGRVYTTELVTKALLFLVSGALMAAAVAASLSGAYRSRPLYAPVTQAAQNLDRYRESLEPLRRVVLVVLPLLLGLFAGSAAAARWQTVLLWLNRTSFGTQDPVFHLDVGFFVFTLPLLRFVVGLLTAVVLLAGITGAATHYLYGGLRLQGAGPRTTRAARVHLAGLAAVLVLLQAASYWLDRYSTLTNSRQVFDGAGYTDVNIVIPARGILAIIAVLCAALFVVAAVRGSWRYPVAGVALLVVSAIVAGGILPALVQRVTVRPSESARESRYIARNITATRAAFRVGEVQSRRYDPATTPQAGALAQDAQTTASIRVLDPAVVSPTFRQQEQNQGFYRFPGLLDVDRYRIDGRNQDTVVAARELNPENLPSSSWVSQHSIYTHGYGLVAAAGNRQGANGLPFFIEQGIPVTGQLGTFEPRIYFGESSPGYSIVGAPAGDRPQELDYPDARARNDQVKYTYTGDGGPRVGGLLTRLLYAVKFRDANILLSNTVNARSQILYDRSPLERVAKVAPFLTLDGDPYPTVVGHRVVWVVDGYTTSREYPYAESQPLKDATTDTLTAPRNSTVAPLPQEEVNYIRNSVKATVDAYSGQVELYAWDAGDPVLRAWQKAFSGTVQPLSRMSGDLVSHVRYPEDLFKVQREVLAKYHVTDPGAFFNRQGWWRVPDDPTSSGTAPVNQPPYYLTLKMPGQSEAAFSLTSTYIPYSRQTSGTRDVLTGFLAVDADAGSTTGARSGGYGRLRLLTMPTDAQIAGPGQVQNNFTTSGDVANELNLLRRGGSTQVINGNLLTLPVGGGLLYVEPVYVETSGPGSQPRLRKVLVSFGGGSNVGFADTLDDALDQAFGGDSGARAGDAGASPAPAPGPSSGGAPGTGGAVRSPELTAALQDASRALQDGQAALAKGDFAGYGAAQTRLQAALARALAADGGVTASPTPPPSASPAPPSASAGPSAVPSPPAGG